MKGQSHALYLAEQYLAGPMIMCFSDTFIETDFSFLDREKSDGVAWVKAVPDPRRFGVAEVNARGLGHAPGREAPDRGQQPGPRGLLLLPAQAKT